MFTRQGLLSLRNALLITLLGGILFSETTVWAEPITYTLSGVASGTFGSTLFTDGTFTIYGYGDATGVFEISPGIFVNPLTEASVTLSGFGTSDVIDPFYFYVNQAIPGAGFIDLDSGDVIDIVGAAFASYDNASSIGPVSVTETALAPFDTTSGTLSLSSLDLEFSAVVSSSVPEPSTLFLCGLAFAGLVAIKRKRAVPGGSSQRTT